MPSAADESLDYDLLIVQVCEFLDNGDGIHRFHGPSQALAALPGVCVIDIDLTHRLLLPLVRQCDVLILAGFDPDLAPLLELRRQQGRITVFEANDFYDDVHPWNPLATRWYDRSIQTTFRQGLEQCDAVQASMPELARRWRLKTSRPVRAFPNQLIDIPPLRPACTGPLTIGWGGSPGHFADWYQLAPRLQAWLDRRPDVHLAVMNAEFARDFLNLPPERYRFVPFGSLQDYFRFLDSLDIGLAPLLPSDYNRCRSDVKYLEYASRGVAGIYADLEPYREAVVPGETGLLYRTEDELFAGLDRLVDDAPFRESLRSRAYEEVARNRRLVNHVGDRLAFYQELLPARPRGGTLSVELLAAGQREGRYLRMVSGPREQPLLQARSTPASPQGVAALERLVRDDPGFLQAAQTLGQQYNDLKQFRPAIDCLERARNLFPESARTQAELARARYLLGDDDQARALLQAAVLANPCLALSWQYLLRFLRFKPTPDAARWDELCRQHHPENYSLALLGTHLYPRPASLDRLRAAILDHRPRLLPDELPAGTAVFSEAIREHLRPLEPSPAALTLLETACAAFPDSASLANLHGLHLRAAGQHDTAYAELSRALRLRRIADLHRLEHPREDGTFHYGQFAEHIERYPPSLLPPTTLAARLR